MKDDSELVAKGDFQVHHWVTEASPSSAPCVILASINICLLPPRFSTSNNKTLVNPQTNRSPLSTFASRAPSYPSTPSIKTFPQRHQTSLQAHKHQQRAKLHARSINPTSKMSAVDTVADSLANTHIAPVAPTGANNVTGGEPINAAENEAVIASAAEGRRLYIGNLAYATTEGDLKEFFTGYSMYVG